MKNTLLKAALESGKIIKENFEGSFEIKSKDVISNLVTEVDTKSEAKIIEIIKSDFPKLAIVFQPLADIGQGLSLKPTWPPLCVLSPGDKSSALQHPKVLRDSGLAHVERFSQFGHRCLSGGKPSQNGAACGIGECRKS